MPGDSLELGLPDSVPVDRRNAVARLARLDARQGKSLLPTRKPRGRLRHEGHTGAGSSATGPRRLRARLQQAARGFLQHRGAVGKPFGMRPQHATVLLQIPFEQLTFLSVKNIEQRHDILGLFPVP